MSRKEIPRAKIEIQTDAPPAREGNRQTSTEMSRTEASRVYSGNSPEYASGSKNNALSMPQVMKKRLNLYHLFKVFQGLP